MDKLKSIKIKNPDGTYTEEIPIEVSIENVDYNDTKTLKQILGNLDITKGTVEERLNFSEMKSISYDDLKALKDGGKLVPGQSYRIIDYVCTITQEEFRVVDHPFDIIVWADDASTLNENARACKREGDEYYVNCNLTAWELKYCLDNDTSRFAWASELGHGVVYYLKDDHNNECPYDFKQIQFARYKITECTVASLIGKYTASQHGEAITGIDEQNPVWCYTFSCDPESTGIMSDASVMEFNADNNVDVSGNVIKAFHSYQNSDEDTAPQIAALNNIVFFGNVCKFNTFGNNCLSNTFGNNCLSNTFGDNFLINVFGDNCQFNAFGSNCHSNTFGNGYSSNVFGNFCASNTFGNNCTSNRFGNGCTSNTFGDYCLSNTFGNTCSSNKFGRSCSSNIFGEKCSSNTFENTDTFNAFGYNCVSNTFKALCQSNTFENNCSVNTFKESCSQNKFGDNCSSNKFGGICSANKFGAGCSSNVFGDSCSFNTFGKYCQSNTFGNNCLNNMLGNGCSYDKLGNFCFFNKFGNVCSYIDILAGESSQYKKYYYILEGVIGAKNSRIQIPSTGNNNFVTCAGMNSSGELKIWVPADLAPVEETQTTTEG